MRWQPVAAIERIVCVGSEVEAAGEQVARRLEFPVRFVVDARLELVIADDFADIVLKGPNRVRVEIVVRAGDAARSAVRHGVGQVAAKSKRGQQVVVAVHAAWRCIEAEQSRWIETRVVSGVAFALGERGRVEASRTREHCTI